jgi:hypothetical protein
MSRPKNVIVFPTAAACERRADDPLALAEARVRSAQALAGDESINRLDWLDRDTICRDLAEALRLIREARGGRQAS